MSAGTVEAYVASLTPAASEVVEELRRRVHALDPLLSQVIRYDIPTFQRDGRSLVHVAAWTKHVSIYPVPDDPLLTADLAPYLAGKGTLKFPCSAPIPWELVDRVLAALVRR